MHALATAVYLSLPLVVAGVLHMVVVRRDWFAFAKVPISERHFGRNKTWRGFLVMPLATLLGVALTVPLDGALGSNLDVHLSSASALSVGLALGLAYVLGELPNSYVKRRLGIAPGALPQSNAAVFAFIDQADSAVACAGAYALLLPVPGMVLAVVCLLGPAIHLVANLSLYAAGLRERPL
jgi:CDP-diacylglycerol--serine O-phosphatidyltransferase